MNVRTSVVREVRINGVDSASALVVGDMRAFLPVSRALAVQREIPTYFGREGAFEVYPVFTRPIPQLTTDDEVQLSIRNTNPFINVNRVNVIAVTSSSLFQIGSLDIIRAEVRLKHIRQLLRGTRPV